MERAYLKKWYLILSFILSLYLVVVTILGFTSLSHEILAPLETIAHYILWFFIAELVVLFFITKNAKTFFKEQWLSIIAVGTSISVTQFADAIVGIGSLTGLRAFKGVKSVKTLKALKTNRILYPQGVRMQASDFTLLVARLVFLSLFMRPLWGSFHADHSLRTEAQIR